MLLRFHIYVCISIRHFMYVLMYDFMSVLMCVLMHVLCVFYAYFLYDYEMILGCFWDVLGMILG